MTDNDLRDQTPCIRGCTWDPSMPGEEPRPRRATHGHLCASCYWRMRHALRTIPDLMANMRLKISPTAIANYESERVSGKAEGSPAPLSVSTLDAFDALFAKLILWIDDLAEKLNATPPSIRVWMGYAEVQGSRPVSAKAAHDQASQLVSWLLNRLETISASDIAVTFHDDICWGWDDSPGVYKLTGPYGVEPPKMRAADKRECPLCGEKGIFVKWPNLLDPSLEIMCEKCTFVAEPEKYGHYAKLFAL